MSLRRLVSPRREITLPDEPEIWDLSSEEAGQAFETLSSETARRTLSHLYEDPLTASELANRLDSSLQNVDYHLKNLLEAGLIEVVSTEYSSTGNEMKVYAPTNNAVLLLSEDSTARRIRNRLGRLFSSLLLIGLGALVFRTLFVGTIIDIPEVEISLDDEEPEPVAEDVDLDDADPADDTYQLDTAEEFVATIDPVEHLPLLLDPGVAFLLGAVFAILVVVGLRRW